MTKYDQWQAWAPQIEAALIEHRGHAGGGDFAHFLYAMDVEGRPLSWILWDISGRQGAEPGAEQAPDPSHPPSVPGDYLFPAEAGRLHVDGTMFRTDSGAIWQWRGYSWFLGFLRYCRGEDVTPDLRWLRANGFNIVRVFGPLPWVQTPDYRVENFDFHQLGPFFDLLEAHGLRCNWSLGHYEHVGLKAHVQRWYDIAGEHWCPIAEAVNEPHVGSEKPDPVALLAGIDRRGVLTSYGLYGSYYDPVRLKRLKELEKQRAKATGAEKARIAAEMARIVESMVPPVLDFGCIHTERDSAWARKARHAQEIQEKIGKPWISDEPAKITEPGFAYPGGKNDPATTPAEAVWHAAIAAIYTAGSTVHTEEGKWGRVPTDDMLQAAVVRAVRDHVWLKIGPEWQQGKYNGSHMSSSPVHFELDVWAYTSILGNQALSVRVKAEPSRADHGWRLAGDPWGPGNSIVKLER